MALAPVVKVYSAKNIVFSFGGVPQPSGYTDGDFLKVEFERSFKKKVGSDGEIARSATNDQSVTITLTLMQTSSSNIYLSAVLALDEGTPNGNGVLPYLIKDVGGTTIMAGVCWLNGPPTDVTFGADVNAVAWTFEGYRTIGAVIGGD